MVYLILIAAFVGLGLLIGPRIAEQGRALSKSLPSLIDGMGSGQLVSRVGEKHGWIGARQAQIQRFVVAHRADLLGYGRVVAEKVAEPAKHIWWLIIIPILSVFFLKDGRSIANGIAEMGSAPEDKSAVRGIVSDVHVMLASYIRAQLILSLLTLVSYTLVLSVMRVAVRLPDRPARRPVRIRPGGRSSRGSCHRFVIGILTSYPHLIWLVLFLGVWHLLQDYVSGPRILGK